MKDNKVNKKILDTLSIAAYSLTTILGSLLFQMDNILFDKDIATSRIILASIVLANILTLVLLIISITKSRLVFKIISVIFLLLGLIILTQYIFALGFSGYPY